MSNYYTDFNTKSSNSQSIIHLINILLGKDIIGLETGIFKGLSFCTFLQCCPNIKHLYGIDNYKPTNAPTNEVYIMDEKEADFTKLLAFHNLAYSGYKEKATIIVKDTSEAVKDFEDNTFDFIFLDSATTSEDCLNELNMWYPKLKKGGIFSGHDWDNGAKPIVSEFYKTKKVENTLSTFDNVWVWIK